MDTPLKVPKDSTPSNLVLGALKLKQRRAFSTCLQVFTKHCFSGSFSLCFRPTAGDTTTCPCLDPLLSSVADQPLGEQGDMLALLNYDDSFDRLIEEYLHPASPHTCDWPLV